MRRQLTPSDFRGSQARLLAQATELDGFLGRAQAAARQAQGQHRWQVVLQQLEQEAADCQAQLRDYIQASPHLQQHLEPGATSPAGVVPGAGGGAGGRGDGAEDAEEAAMEAALQGLPEGLVPGAVSLTTVVAELLAASRGRGVPLQAETVEGIQGHLAALQQELGCATAALGDVAGSLGRAARRLAAGAAAPSARSTLLLEEEGLAGGVQALCRQWPVAEAGLRQHLVDAAQEMEAAHLQQREQRTAAYAACLQGGGRGRESDPTETAGGNGGPPAAAGWGSVESASDTPELAECGTWQPGAASEAGAIMPPPVREEGLAGGGPPLDSDGSSGSWFSGSLVGVAWAAATGWTEDEQAAFASIKQDCLAACGPAVPQAQVLECMRQRLPGKSPAQLRAYWGWHKEAGRLRSAVVQLQRGWEAEAAAFMSAAAALLESSSAEVLQRAEAAAGLLEWEVAAAQRAQSLEGQLADKAAAEAQHAQQRLWELEQQAQQAEAQRAQQERYRERVAATLAQHREAQLAQQEEMRAQQEAEQARQAEQAAAAAAVNKQRVQFRRQQASERAAAAQQAERKIEQEEARRATALDRLRAQVAPAAARDPARATGPTASTRAPAGPKEGRAFRQLFGLTTDDVLKDQRFRLLEALRALNLQASGAGREALAAARPARPPRPESLTSAQRLARQWGLG